MNKFLFLATVSIALMVSCSRVSPDEGVTKNENGIELTNSAIGFQAYNYLNQTKTNNWSEFYSEGAFNVFAYYTNGDWDDLTQLSDAILYMNEEEVKCTDNVWKTSNTYYWPKTGKISFFAYYPSSIKDYASFVNMTDKVQLSDYSVSASVSAQKAKVKTKKVNGIDVITDDQNDVMIADAALDQTGNATHYYASGVPVLFRHKLAKVRFTAQMNCNGSVPGVIFKIVLNSISIDDIYNTGSYNGSSWSTGSNTPDADSGNIYYSSYLPSEGDTFDYDEEGVLDGDSIQKGLDYYVLPQDLADASKIAISYTVYALDGNDKVLSCTSYGIAKTLNSIMDTTTPTPVAIDKWEINKIYNYNFQIDAFAEEIKFDPAIENWDSNTINSDNVTL